MGILIWIIGIGATAFGAVGLLCWLVAGLDALLVPPAVRAERALAGMHGLWPRMLRELLWGVWVVHLLAGALHALGMAPRPGRDVLREAVVGAAGCGPGRQGARAERRT